jgi:alpha-mannosidase
MISKKILLERAEKWLSPIYWTDVNIRSALYGAEAEVRNLTVYQPEEERPHVSDVLTRMEEFVPTQVGNAYGPIWSSKWFHFDIEIPPHMDGTMVCLKWDSNSEAMIYSNEGKLLQAFTGGGGSDRRDLYIISTSATGGEKRSYFVEMACNEMFGNGEGGMIKPPGPNKTFTLSTVQLVSINEPGQALFWDMHVLYEMVKTLPDNCPTAATALGLMTQIINSTTLHSDSSIAAAHTQATAFFQSGTHCKVDHDLFAFGHCHIDTAWLWPYAETRRKIARSWVTQIDLLRRYTNYRFVASQTVQFEWLLQDHPEVMTDIKQLVKSHKFLPVGGTYVEFDAYMPSGESMIRQFLYGFQFMKMHFDIAPSIFWLPDTFGYSSQLPQIMQGFGVKYFLSQKLSWNLLNV